MSLDVVGDFNNETNFPHQSVLTNTQVARISKASKNNSSANIKLSKNQLHKIWQSGRFLGILLGQLLKAGFPTIKNALTLYLKVFYYSIGIKIRM